MNTTRILALALLALAHASGCSGAPTTTTNPDTATSGSAVAGDVEMTVLADALDGKAAQRFTEAGAEAKIRELAAASLRSTGRWADGMSVTVTVEDFRLRTAGAVAVGGIMSGADRIDAQVAVLKNGQVVRSEKVSAMSRQGGMVGAKESKRLEGLVTMFAENMAKLI